MDQLSLLTPILCFLLLPPIASSATFDVAKYGAIGDGKTDDSQAFLRAWAEVCNDASGSSLLNVASKTFLLNAVVNFRGPCKPSSITVQITGVIVAPGDVKSWRGNTENWLMFSGVYGLTLTGTGIIDGKGQGWWDMCRYQNKTICIHRPAQVYMNGCNNLVVKGLTLANGQRSHLAITSCNDVLLSQLTITAPGESPNTDGIDVSNSRRVRIEWSTIATGDDCIAINRGTYQINITGIVCGPGHGISIGSLGKDKNASEEVADVIVKQCNFTRAKYGARIKTWVGGVGFARRITFEDINFVSTGNPIIIDQTYCDISYTDCKSLLQPGVKVEEVTYLRMHGTSSNPVAVTLACSPLDPCSGLVLKEVVIRRNDGSAAASYCSNALGFIGKECEPEVDCLIPISEFSSL